MLDRVILVDESDHPIGTMDKYEAHRHGASLHRAISVYLFRNVGTQTEPNWEVLLQQRSAQKIVGGGMWANTVCGNVRPGESYRECAYRRLREELGLPTLQIEASGLEAVYKFLYFAECNEEFSEREIDQVFVGVVDDSLALWVHPDEVTQTKWVSFDKIAVWGNQPDGLTGSDVSGGKDQTSKDMIVAPWFILMMRDNELLTTLKLVLDTRSEIKTRAKTKK